MQAAARHPIRLVTSMAILDSVARILAPPMTRALDRQVTVENHDGTAAAEIVAAAPPDGNTLLMTAGNLWYGPLVGPAPYDPQKDFAPLAMVATSPLVAIVHPSVPAATMQEWIALLKAHPGEYKYGSGLNGSSSQFAGALFAHMANVDIVRVSYPRGGFVGVEDLAAGKVHFMMPSTGSGMPYVKSGRARALAVTSAGPSRLAPGLPTVAACGLPGYEFVQSIAVFAPAGTARDVVEPLNRGMAAVLDSAEVRERLLEQSVEVAPGSPEALAERMAAEIRQWRQVIAQTHMQGI